MMETAGLTMMEIVKLVAAIAAVVGAIVAIANFIVNIKPPKPPPTKKPTEPLKLQQTLETRYRQVALEACDIIDLANLPEDDRHLATRNLELRRLYVALRLRLEIEIGDEVDDKTLAALEERRTQNWGEAGRRNDDEKGLVSLGERLQGASKGHTIDGPLNGRQPADATGEDNRRTLPSAGLVVLGDPGAGKSTLLRWLATAYLLRLKDDPDFSDLPDIASLPEESWLPILVRCRDLPTEADTLEAMLLHALRKSQLPEDQCADLGALLRGRLQAGAAILLVDGLDEITEPGARARFSQQLEQIHRAYPDAPMVVTSRIVGYREMGYRIRSGFEHLTVADLSKGDKDEFARRWSNLTERPERRAAAAEELIRDIHSTDRIERLTGNPMLLTTMALIKRKIGRLPQRRVDLYEKAVEVLLNWRSEVDPPLDDSEALPQLEYMAHAMCADGVQRLQRDEILALLREMREKYPNIHPLTQHTPEEFLRLLETRAGLLIQSGHAKHNGLSVPVYEFCHLTFQEYLAGIALVQGHYRGWEKGRTLAEVVASLAGQVRSKDDWGTDIAVVENWREPLRLAVAACNPNEVEKVLRAILRPYSAVSSCNSDDMEEILATIGRSLPGESETEKTVLMLTAIRLWLQEEKKGTKRARAVLAGLCLADKPDVSETLAREILQALAAQVDGDGNVSITVTSLDLAIIELAQSRWAGLLGDYLLDEFLRRDGKTKRENVGALCGRVRETHVPEETDRFSAWLTEQAKHLTVCSEREAADIALTVAYLAEHSEDCRNPGLIDGLLQRLSGSAALSNAAAWALWEMNDEQDRERAWHPTPIQQEQLIAAVTRPDCDSNALLFLSWIFGNERVTEAVVPLLARLGEDYPDHTCVAIVEALGEIGDLGAVEALMARLQDTEEDTSVRCAAARALGKIGTEPARAVLGDYLKDPNETLRCATLGGLAQGREDETDRKLLSRDLHRFGPWLDPAVPIDAARIEEAARELEKPPEELRRRYQGLAARFGLTLAE
ncbi:MAG: NACHT domain-containing protein [Candidatus Kentron sp. G]|nr:MAG: NACHT domain-containing protein [Candidatus Kentron sp. G]VFN00110.1 MAG: NACHT domain-containing protein [Candidatus Kentron sp. G]VFN02214.1 MAG: NACHT domain-containing protein [Candidatus Kentron sp. G]